MIVCYFWLWLFIMDWSLRSISVIRGVALCLAGAWADSASVELSDVLISVIILSLTVIFLSVYPRNEPVC